MNFAFAQTAPIIVSREELLAFHNIDRNLYTRLTIRLGCEPTESMNVMGLWLWYERCGLETHLVSVLNYVPDNVLIALTNESVWVLKCIQSEDFTNDLRLHNEIPLTERFTKTNLSLYSFFQNRAKVLIGVKRSVDEVCLRALDDLYRQAMLNKAAGGGQAGTGVYRPSYPIVHHLQGQHDMRQKSPQQIDVQNETKHNYGVLSGRIIDLNYSYDPSSELGYQQSQLYDFSYHGVGRSNVGNKTTSIIPPDQRTILLVFSKGYPLSEKEIGEYFTRNFGDCIEAIYMQDDGKQPQNAKFIVPSPEYVDYILGMNHSAKFTINGIPVWACRFVNKLEMSSVLPDTLD